MHFKTNLQGFLGAILLILGLCGALYADNVQGIPASESGLQFDGSTNVVDQVSSRGAYYGNLKLYVIEPDGGRWDDSQNHTFEMSFLDFAYDTVLVMDVEEQFNRNIDWTPNYSGVTEDNVMVIAVLFDRNAGYPASSDTIGGHNLPFTAYYPDAVVGCVPGETNSAGPAGSFTHTVFVEDHSTTW